MSSLNHTSCLIVDDSSAIRKIVRQLLTRIGITNIREAEDSIEALERLKSAPSDLAIVDHDLGTFTGVDFIRMLRTARGSPAGNIGLILLTALNDEKLKEQAIEAGADDYLVKPVSQDMLKTCMLYVLNKRQKLDISEDTDDDSTIYI